MWKHHFVRVSASLYQPSNRTSPMPTAYVLHQLRRFAAKVRIFSEGHKIWKNLPHLKKLLINVKTK